MNDNPVRFGLIGFGAWGQHHANAISITQGAQLVAICARSQASRDAAAEQYPGARVYADMSELAACDDLDVVDVVLPSDLHLQAAQTVLSAGKHLLLEKPMGISLSQCNTMLDASRAADRMLVIGHELRLSSLWGQVKAMIDADYIGKPRYALVELSRNPYRQGADGWRYDIDRVGSWILEEPIHFFDLARWYLSQSGDPQTIYANASSRQTEHPELHDNFSAMMQFGDGAYAIVSQTLAAFEHHQTVKITGTRGALWASWSGKLDRTRHASWRLRAFDGNEVVEVPIEKPTGELFELEDQIQRLVAAIEHQGPLHCTGEDGLWSVAMCLAAEASVRSGQAEPIRLK